MIWIETNMLMETVLLFIAGFFGGALNSIAGGGSFITFPALLAAGVPAISANATNTFASLPGYMAGAWVLRHNMMKAREKLPLTVIIAFIGGIMGAWLLLHTPKPDLSKSYPGFCYLRPCYLSLAARLITGSGITLNIIATLQLSAPWLLRHSC